MLDAHVRTRPGVPASCQRIVRQRRAEHVGIVDERTNRLAESARPFRHLDERRTTKEQTQVTVCRPRRGVEQRSTRPAGVILLIGLRITARQIFLADGFDRVFPGDDIAGSQPGWQARAIIRMASSSLTWRQRSTAFCATWMPGPTPLAPRCALLRDLAPCR